jgi:transcriptional regulator with XRE-family HTH domain
MDDRRNRNQTDHIKARPELRAIRQELGRIVRDARQAAGMSSSGALASAVESRFGIPVSRDSIDAIESGREYDGSALLYRISRTLNLELF